MFGAIFRGIARLLLGKSAVESAQQISQASRQKKQLQQTAKTHGEQAQVSSERQALLEEAKRTQAHVNATMDDETRQKIQETAERLMKDGK